MLASTSGSEAGAAGARELLDELPEREIAAVIVISQPGAGDPAPAVRGRELVDRRPSASVQLERTAELAVETQAESRPRRGRLVHAARPARDPQPGSAGRRR